MRQNGLRGLAEELLDRTFSGLEPALRADLATSLVRQWVTNGGRAVIATEDGLYWLGLERLADGGYLVSRTVEDAALADELRARGVLAAEIPDLLHDLTLRQCAGCETADGEEVLLRIDPVARRFSIERGRDAA